MLPIEMHDAVANFRFDFGIRLGMETPPTNLASNCSYMSRNMVQMDRGITYSLTRHAPRILSVGVFFHGLF